MILRRCRRICEAILPSLVTDTAPALHDGLLIFSVPSRGSDNLAKIHSRASRNDPASSSEPTALHRQGPYATRLKSRGVIGFEGQETVKFLQGMTTNDVSRFDEESSAKLPQPAPNQPSQVQPPMYTALLTPQGRFLYDMFLYKPVSPAEMLDRSGSHPGSDGKGLPVLLADVDAASAEDLINHLNRYRLRSKVQIKNVSENFCVWQRFGGMMDVPDVREEAGSIGWGGGKDLAGNTAAEGDAEGWRWYTDPRLPELGSRGLFPANVTPPLVEANEEVGEEFYLLWRLEQGVPEGPIEIPTGEAIPLEYNLAGLSAISFTKGCYVGQELVARTTHRGIIRKRLMPVNFVNYDSTEVQQAAAPGAEIQDRISGKKVGFVTTVLGSRGLALIRLEASEKDLVVNTPNQVFVKVIRPKWWPDEWGHATDQRVSTA